MTIRRRPVIMRIKSIARRALQAGPLVAGSAGPATTGVAVDGNGPIYVLATAISGDDSATTYVKTMNAPPTGMVDLKDTREFPGWSDIKTSGGKIFVSTGEGATVTRFGVGRDGVLVEEGKVSFLGHAKEAPMYLHAFIAPDKAYFLADTGDFVVWNPAMMEIRGTVALPRLAARENIDASPSLDRGMIVRGNRIYHAVSWTNYKDYKMVATSAIVIVDTKTDRFVETLEAPCPDLNVATADAADNLYFSNWVYSPAATIMNGGASACAVKIPAGAETIDPAATLSFKALTGGHEAAAVSILSNGKALISVFFEDHQPFDKTKDDVFKWLFGANWQSYELDLGSRAVKPLPGIGWHSGGYYTGTLDGTDYLLMPGDGYTSTTFHRIEKDGTTTSTAQTKGWATRLFRVR